MVLPDSAFSGIWCIEQWPFQKLSFGCLNRSKWEGWGFCLFICFNKNQFWTPSIPPPYPHRLRSRSAAHEPLHEFLHPTEFHPSLHHLHTQRPSSGSWIVSYILPPLAASYIWPLTYYLRTWRCSPRFTPCSLFSPAAFLWPSTTPWHHQACRYSNDWAAQALNVPGLVPVRQAIHWLNLRQARLSYQTCNKRKNSICSRLIAPHISLMLQSKGWRLGHR